MSASREPLELLTAIDLFAGLSKREARRLVDNGREVTHPKGNR